MANEPRSAGYPPVPIVPEFLWPDYGGGSIGNIPATVAALLNVPYTGLPPLRDSLWKPLSGDVRRVVSIVIDALGWNLFTKERSIFQPLEEKAQITGSLTSIFPSTTVAALSSIWTGAAPAQHGLVGLRMFFPEMGTIGEMLKLSPTFGRYPDALVEAGLDPQEFLRWPGMAEQLAASGVQTHAFKGQQIIHSALSKMHGRGVAGDHGVTGLADMLVQVRRMLEEQPSERLYLAAYWSAIDTLSHRDGWSGETVAAELRAILYQLLSEFIDSLHPTAREGTVLIVFADHGQVETAPAQRVYLEDHPTLAKMLLMKPTGEPRAAYLYTRHGCQEDALVYCQEHLPEALVAWRTEEVLEAGLFGPPPFAEQTADRLGDLVLAMREGYVLLESREVDEETANYMRGRHGGMTEAEMRVPWLGFRLDR